MFHYCILLPPSYIVFQTLANLKKKYLKSKAQKNITWLLPTVKIYSLLFHYNKQSRFVYWNCSNKTYLSSDWQMIYFKSIRTRCYELVLHIVWKTLQTSWRPWYGTSLGTHTCQYFHVTSQRNFDSGLPSSTQTNPLSSVNRQHLSPVQIKNTCRNIS